MNDQQIKSLAKTLNKDLGTLPSLDLLDRTINDTFKGKIALVSSFGTEAALLLSLISCVNKATPVIFLNTGMHFPETLEYRDALIKQLGLTDVRSIKPEPSAIKAADPQNDLWQREPNGCCYLRKVVPLAEALSGFDAWINGRKRIHGGTRTALPTIEHDGRHIKINAIADWTQEMIDTYWQKHNLPEHPMVPFGYTSVGCKPEACTALPKTGEGKRSGRWAAFDKQECGIHNIGGWDDTSGGI